MQRIERLNPLFPVEAGHELAATQTDPLDTVLSLSREMVTAVCHVLGAEPMAGSSSGRLDQLRYPARPATSAYRPESADIRRVVLGELGRSSAGRSTSPRSPTAPTWTSRWMATPSSAATWRSWP